MDPPEKDTGLHVANEIERLTRNLCFRLHQRRSAIIMKKQYLSPSQQIAPTHQPNTGQNGYTPKRPQSKRPHSKTSTNQNSHTYNNQNGHNVFCLPFNSFSFLLFELLNNINDSAFNRIKKLKIEKFGSKFDTTLSMVL